MAHLNKHLDYKLRLGSQRDNEEVLAWKILEISLRYQKKKGGAYNSNLWEEEEESFFVGNNQKEVDDLYDTLHME